MRALTFSKRNIKEILRDPLSLIFGVGFPVVLMTAMHLLSKSIESMPDFFSISSLAPGMVVFGLSFLSIFLGILISGDRETAFLARLFASPLTASDFLFGYSLPCVGVGVIQSAASFCFACLLGFRPTWKLLLCVLVLAADSLLYISIGVLSGTLFSQKAMSAFNTIIVNLSAWMSGTWFDLGMIKGGFKTVCEVLPFYHAVDAVKNTLGGDSKAVLLNLAVVLAYSAVIFIVAGILFKRKMKD